jgi:hypothetical protein
MSQVINAGTVIAAALSVQAAAAQVTFVSQQRVIAASTSADANTVTASAPDFGRFVHVVAAATPFPTPDGTPAPNEGETGIDCEIDPNAITARGSLGAAGGISVTGQPVFGEADALVDVTFTLAQATPYRLFATARPSDNPRDEFEVELQDNGTGVYLVRVNETMPTQTLDRTGVLAPGTYTLHYQVEFSHDGPGEVRPFEFRFQIGSTCVNADFNNDGDTGTDADIEAFFACLAGACCPTCFTADFDGDGSAGTDADVEAFFRALSGGSC